MDPIASIQLLPGMPVYADDDLDFVPVSGEAMEYLATAFKLAKAHEKYPAWFPGESEEFPESILVLLTDGHKVFGPFATWDEAMEPIGIVTPRLYLWSTGSMIVTLKGSSVLSIPLDILTKPIDEKVYQIECLEI